jgi:hypothetical protein
MFCKQNEYEDITEAFFDSLSAGETSDGLVVRTSDMSVGVMETQRIDALKLPEKQKAVLMQVASYINGLYGRLSKDVHIPVGEKYVGVFYKEKQSREYSLLMKEYNSMPPALRRSITFNDVSGDIFFQKGLSIESLLKAGPELKYFINLYLLAAQEINLAYSTAVDLHSLSEVKELNDDPQFPYQLDLKAFSVGVYGKQPTGDLLFAKKIQGRRFIFFGDIQGHGIYANGVAVLYRHLVENLVYHLEKEHLDDISLERFLYMYWQLAASVMLFDNNAASAIGIYEIDPKKQTLKAFGGPQTRAMIKHHQEFTGIDPVQFVHFAIRGEEIFEALLNPLSVKDEKKLIVEIPLSELEMLLVGDGYTDVVDDQVTQRSKDQVRARLPERVRTDENQWKSLLPLFVFREIIKRKETLALVTKRAAEHDDTSFLFMSVTPKGQVLKNDVQSLAIDTDVDFAENRRAQTYELLKTHPVFTTTAIEQVYKPRLLCMDDNSEIASEHYRTFYKQILPVAPFAVLKDKDGKVIPGYFYQVASYRDADNLLVRRAYPADLLMLDITVADTNTATGEQSGFKLFQKIDDLGLCKDAIKIILTNHDVDDYKAEVMARNGRIINKETFRVKRDRSIDPQRLSKFISSIYLFISIHKTQGTYDVQKMLEYVDVWIRNEEEEYSQFRPKG